MGERAGPGDEQDVGHIHLDVQYLRDITVGCPTCHGSRFNDATLAVRIDGLTVADVLGLSVDDALKRFADHEPSTGLHPLDVATPDGGHIVAAGTPQDVARAPGSVTGPWLAEHLGLPEARQGRSSLSSTWAALDGGPRLGWPDTIHFDSAHGQTGGRACC